MESANVSGNSGRSIYRNAADGWPGRAVGRSSDAGAPVDVDWAGAAALACTSVAVVFSADFPNMVCLLLRRELLIQQVNHDLMQAAMGRLLRFNSRAAKSTVRTCAKQPFGARISINSHFDPHKKTNRSTGFPLAVSV